MKLKTKSIIMSTGCETMDEFFRRNVNRIVPIVLRTLGLAEAVSFCSNCAGTTFDEVFENVFPSCFTWLISRVMFNDADKEMMRKMTRNTDEFANTRDFSQLFHSRLQDVLMELIQRLHDEDDFERVLSITDVRFPVMDPPHFSRTTLDFCFDYLESSGFLVASGKTLTCTLVEHQPATLQRILLRLASAVHSSRFREDKFKQLHQYAYFCFRLTRDLAKPVFDEMAAFLIRDMCHSLLHMTRGNDDNDDETLTMACCKFLDLFLRRALPARAAEVRDVLRFVVADLIGLARSNTNSGVNRVAASLLNFLVVEQKDVLREAIAKLGSFPSHEIFRDAREARNAVRSEKDRIALCLEDELELFLDATSEENAECTLEDLANLTRQLSTRKRELRDLHRKLERPYPDGANILSRLIFK